MAAGSISAQPPDPAAWIHQLGSIPDAEVRRDFFAHEPAAHNLQSAERLHAEVLRLAYVDIPKAARLAEAAEWLAGLLDDPAARAFSLRAQGHVHFAQGQYGKAVEYYEAALKLLEQTGREIDAGRTLSSGLQALIYLGRYDQAFEWAERARVIYKRHGDELRLARLESNIGNILFRQDRHAEALEQYQKAREPLGRLGEPRDVAAVLSNMAVCATSLGRFSEALGHYRAAREHSIRHKLPLLVSAADYNIAYLHYLRGDYIEAMRLYRVSRARAEEAGDFYHSALCDLDESEMCLELNLSEEGSQLAERAAMRFKQAGMRYERAKAVVNQAIAASHGGRVGAASHLLRRARRLFEGEQNSVWPALIDLYQAFICQRQGELGEARALAERAASVLNNSAMAGKADLCRLLQARLLKQEGRLDEARAMCARILGSADRGIGPSLRFHVHFLLGQIEEQTGNWDAAWTGYQNARQEVETLRSRLWGDEPRISILKDKLAVYEALVWMSLWRRPAGQSSAREAFLLISEAKSRSLADQLAFPLGPPARRAHIDNEEIRAARGDLHGYYRQIERQSLDAGPDKAEQIEALRRQARQCEDRIMRALGESRGAGQPHAMPDISAQPDFEAIRAAIPREAVLLEYYEVRGVIYVCLLSRDRLQLVPLGPTRRIRSLLRLFQFQVSKFRLGPEYQQTFREPMLAASLAHLEELYTELIHPVRRLLKAEHLIIAGHSFLHTLPFHALHHEGRFLLDDFSISYAPSGRVFCLCGARRPEYKDESLVMGVPDAATPHIEGEARYAAASLPNARLRLGPDATEAELRRYGPSSRFIHVATHGLFRSDNPMFSSIQLGDSHFSLIDLYQLPLSAELVTLSGCSTGLNAVVGGDELLGLIRGLFYAGAHSVLASLWDVHDRSTAEFMTAFYGRLKTQNKAQALRAAMNDLRKEYPHPYYWAPFILVGRFLGR